MHPFHRGYRVLLGAALLAPGVASAQESARPAVEVRLLGGLVNPGLSGLNEAFAGYRAAEQSGAPLRREPGVRRAVAGEIAGDERFGAGVGGALEVGISAPASEGRRLGLGLRLGYDRVRAGYSASFQDRREGSREELLQVTRVSLVPRYSFVTRAFTATLGATAGVGRLEYRNDARTALVSPSGASTNPSAGFAGHDSFWSVGGLAEVERRLFGRASLTAGIGYDHVPTVELPVSGSDFDAPYRSLSTDPFPTPTLLAFPEEGGTMGEKPVPVDLSGWRAEVGVRLRVGK